MNENNKFSDTNEQISKGSIVKLARRSGIQIMNKDTIEIVNDIISYELDDIIKSSISVKNVNKEKTLMKDHVYSAMKLKGDNYQKIL